MPQLFGSFTGQVGGPLVTVLAVTEEEVFALLPETVLAPNPLRANARTNPRINKASMGKSPFELQTRMKKAVLPAMARLGGHSLQVDDTKRLIDSPRGGRYGCNGGD
jgi:hypothetical protein